MAPRISPLKDATHYVLSKSDKTCKLEVKYINEVKGKMLSDVIYQIIIMYTIYHLIQNVKVN